MTLLKKYKWLTRMSDIHYGLAIQACTTRDEQTYKTHMDMAWEFADRAKQMFDHLRPETQKKIKAAAYAAMATGFVRGLFGGAK